MMATQQHAATEWSLQSDVDRGPEAGEVTVDAVVTYPDGTERPVPAFWSGGRTWTIRWSSPQVGRHSWTTLCSDPDDADLHGREGTVEVTPDTGEYPLLSRGALRVAASRRYLEHRDGTPFFWLGDTWWMGLCQRLGWPGEFQALVRDRIDKGFTVVQIVAGLYPDMPAFDERGRNEAGFPWREGWEGIRPEYFDLADRRIHYLVREGLVPCIVGCWGYYLPWLGGERMRQHWRYLVARWGAYPVIWCPAGEGSMPYYLSEDKEGDRQRQQTGWTEMARYLRQIDPYGHPITIHPSVSARATVDDPAVLDLDMLQTGHGDRGSIPNTLRVVGEAYRAAPPMPVVQGEVCYEGIGEACRQEVQRYMVWACVLSGAAGFTYGANGIWQVNTRRRPYGASPHGMAWGHTPWDEAAQLPGSSQIGLARRLLERYEWWRFEPRPEWVADPATPERWQRPLAAGIAGQVRVLYLPSGVWGIEVQGLEADRPYSAYLYDPVNGDEIDLGPAEVAADGTWRPPLARQPIYQDWVVVLDATAG
ncbi:MAG: DUF4038 domain-containing protein [Gemmatimonadota bacterium]